MDTLSLGSARSAQEVRLSLCDEQVESFRDGRLTSPVYFDGKTGGVGPINEDTQSKSNVVALLRAVSSGDSLDLGDCYAVNVPR